MNKNKKSPRARALELKTETVIHLTHDLLKFVGGGVNSTQPSQCVTLCF